MRAEVLHLFRDKAYYRVLYISKFKGMVLGVQSLTE